MRSELLESAPFAQQRGRGAGKGWGCGGYIAAEPIPETQLWMRVPEHSRAHPRRAHPVLIRLPHEGFSQAFILASLGRAELNPIRFFKVRRLWSPHPVVLNKVVILILSFQMTARIPLCVLGALGGSDKRKFDRNCLAGLEHWAS